MYKILDKNNYDTYMFLCKVSVNGMLMRKIYGINVILMTKADTIVKYQAAALTINIKTDITFKDIGNKLRRKLTMAK